MGSRYIEMVEKATKAAGFWVPTIARNVKLLSIRQAGTTEVTEVWSGAQRDTVLSLKINKPIPPKNFEIMLPPGTQVGRDPALGENYVVEGDPTQFKDKLKEARLKGEQPDFEACDFSAIEAEVKSGKVKPEYVSDHVEHITLETQAEDAEAKAPAVGVSK